MGLVFFSQDQCFFPKTMPWTTLGFTSEYLPHAKPLHNLRALRQLLLSHHRIASQAAQPPVCAHEGIEQLDKWRHSGELRAGPYPFDLAESPGLQSPKSLHTHSYSAFTCPDCDVKLKFDLAQLEDADGTVVMVVRVSIPAAFACSGDVFKMPLPVLGVVLPGIGHIAVDSPIHGLGEVVAVDQDGRMHVTITDDHVAELMTAFVSVFGLACFKKLVPTSTVLRHIGDSPKQIDLVPATIGGLRDEVLVHLVVWLIQSSMGVSLATVHSQANPISKTDAAMLDGGSRARKTRPSEVVAMAGASALHSTVSPHAYTPVTASASDSAPSPTLGTPSSHTEAEAGIESTTTPSPRGLLYMDFVCDHVTPLTHGVAPGPAPSAPSAPVLTRRVRAPTPSRPLKQLQKKPGRPSKKRKQAPLRAAGCHSDTGCCSF